MLHYYCGTAAVVSTATATPPRWIRQEEERFTSAEPTSLPLRRYDDAPAMLMTLLK